MMLTAEIIRECCRYSSVTFSYDCNWFCSLTCFARKPEHTNGASRATETQTLIPNSIRPETLSPKQPRTKRLGQGSSSAAELRHLPLEEIRSRCPEEVEDSRMYAPLAGFDSCKSNTNDITSNNGRYTHSPSLSI